MPCTYAWPRPSVTVDAAIIAAVKRAAPQLLLIQRKKPPCKQMWALPGGFVDENEPLDVAAARELHEETGVQGVQLTQVGAFGDPGRDPRGWCVTVAYAAIVPTTQLGVQAAVRTQPSPCHQFPRRQCCKRASCAQDDAADAQWFDVLHLPPLAFDHQLVVRACFRAMLRQPHAQEHGGCCPCTCSPHCTPHRAQMGWLMRLKRQHSGWMGHGSPHVIDIGSDDDDYYSNPHNIDR